MSNGDETAGAHDGIRTRDPNLTKIVRYLCATWAKIFDCLDGSADLLLTHSDDIQREADNVARIPHSGASHRPGSQENVWLFRREDTPDVE